MVKKTPKKKPLDDLKRIDTSKSPIALSTARASENNIDFKGERDLGDSKRDTQEIRNDINEVINLDITQTSINIKEL